MNIVKLVNQNDYPDKIYITKTKKPEPQRINGLTTTIASSGCGICCGMMVGQFFGFDMSMDEAISLAYQYDANDGAGTKYKPYSLGLFDKFGLIVERTDNKEKLFKHLDEGGCAVANVGGDHDDHIGVFSHVGHYIFINKHENDDVYILDPGIEPHKYEEENRKDKVRFTDEFVVSDFKYLADDLTNRETPIFLFKKKKDNATVEDAFNMVDSLKDQFVEIWKKVVEIESPSHYKEGVDEVGSFFIDYAAKQVWDIEVQKNEIAGDAICITMNGNGKSKPIAISGHMDTVHPVGSMKTYIENNKMYGPGCTDCKGGLIVGLMAMKALKEIGYTSRTVKFILQSDEEVGSSLSDKKTIEFMCEQAKDCIGFLNMEMMEPGTAVLTRKGISRYKMIFKGIGAHSSVCDQGASAIKEASYKIIELEKMHDSEAITVNVGTIEGGTTPNSVPDFCSIQIDVRFNNEEERIKADEYIRDIANKNYVKGVSTELKYLSSRMAMDYKDYNENLLNRINETFIENGLSVLKARKAKGGSDAAYTSAYGIPSIDSIGVTGGYIHSKNEYADIDSLSENAKRLVSIIMCIEG